MKKTLAVLLIVFAATASCAAAGLSFLRSAASGVSIGLDGQVRFSAEALMLNSTEQFNAGFRADVTTSGESTVYPLFIRGRLGIFSLEAGIGYAASDKSVAAYAMPAVSLFFGKIGMYIGFPVLWTPQGFTACAEAAVTLN